MRDAMAKRNLNCLFAVTALYREPSYETMRAAVENREGRKLPFLTREFYANFQKERVLALFANKKDAVYEKTKASPFYEKDSGAYCVFLEEVYAAYKGVEKDVCFLLYSPNGSLIGRKDVSFPPNLIERMRNEEMDELCLSALLTEQGERWKKEATAHRSDWQWYTLVINDGRGSRELPFTKTEIEDAVRCFPERRERLSQMLDILYPVPDEKLRMTPLIMNENKGKRNRNTDPDR